jgi:hypothetical protein
LDEAFQSIGLPNESPVLRDLSVLFYMENIEMIEASSLETMMRVANKLQLANVLQL